MSDIGDTGPDAPHDAYAALRHRDFRLFLVNAVMATIGGEMQSVAVGWELYERTGSKLALAWVGLVQAAPVLLLSLWAGHVADRFRRKSIVMATAAVMTCGSLGLAAVSWAQAPVWAYYACLGVIGVAGAFSFPARWAFMPELVPAEDFHNAVTWRSSAWQVAAMIGPGLGGLGIAVFKSATPVYLADAACGAVVLAMIAAIRGRPSAGKAAREPMTWGTLSAGFRYVWNSPLVLAAITLDMFAVLLGGSVALLPVFAKDVLRIGPVGLGVLRAAPSLGALLMALTLAHRPPLKRAGRDLLMAVAGFGVATVVFGLSRSPALSFLMLFLTGAFDNISVVIRSTLIQVRTPDVMRGRVAAVNSIFIGMSNEVGAFESGAAAWLLGTVPSVVFGGLGCVAVVILTALKWPEIGRLGALDRLDEADDLAVAPAGTGGAPMIAWVEEFRSALESEFGPRPRLGTLATVDLEGRPRARSVVCREVEADGSIRIVADARGDKVAQLRSRPFAEVVFWLANRREQYRLSGPVEIAPAGDDRRASSWGALSDPARALFSWPHPGEPRAPDASFPEKVGADAAVPGTFALLVLHPDGVDHLDLNGHPHRRRRWERGRWGEINP